MGATKAGTKQALDFSLAESGDWHPAICLLSRGLLSFGLPDEDEERPLEATAEEYERPAGEQARSERHEVVLFRSSFTA
jgi:hypothetical protein